MGYDVVTVGGLWRLRTWWCTVARVAQANGWVRERGGRVRCTVNHPGMPSPPVVSLRLPEHLARFVQEQAEQQFRSRNSWVAELIAREYEAVKGGVK